MNGILTSSSSCLTILRRSTNLGLRRRFTVLALESSADDTCAAVVTDRREILANVVVKQNELYVLSHEFSTDIANSPNVKSHEQFNGIEPITAIRAHHRNMVSSGVQFWRLT
jgi:N6-L-threonylcarbamoyladenine synthase